VSVISKRVARELSDPAFRKSYKRARVRSKIVYQIRALRKQRDWLQGKLAEIMGKPQSTVSRFEDADYGKLTLETLFEISDAFDLGLIVEFVSYPEFLMRTSNLSVTNLMSTSYSESQMEFLTREIGIPSADIHNMMHIPAANIEIKIKTISSEASFDLLDSTAYESNIPMGSING